MQLWPLGFITSGEYFAAFGASFGMQPQIMTRAVRPLPSRSKKAINHGWIIGVIRYVPE